MNPINEMNMSPHDRPKVSTNVANKPELNVQFHHQSPCH
jgi:hypothetical protein